MNKYPSTWLCKNCHGPFKLHVKIGAPNEEGVEADSPAMFNWCYSRKASKYGDNPSIKFTPVDNLTLIELLAKKKGRIRGIKTGTNK